MSDSAPTTDLTPAEAVGWQIIDTLDEETRARLLELIDRGSGRRADIRSPD